MLIVCSGMLRSGSTLQYNLIRALVERLGSGVGRGWFTPDQLTDLGDALTYWGDDTNYHVIKVHETHPKIVEMAEKKSARIFYIHRDIRDVAVSTQRQFGYKWEKLVRVLDQAVAFHYEIEGIEGTLRQKYEDVKDDLPAAVRAQASFLGLKPPENVVSAVAEECSLEGATRVTRDMRKRLGVKAKCLLRYAGIPIYDDHTLLHPGHISKDAGATGVWRTSLSDGEISFINRHYRAWLQKEGYLRDVSTAPRSTRLIESR